MTIDRVQLEPRRRPAGRAKHQHRGFTLLEAVMAAAILLGIVTAVTSALVAGQQHAYEARQRITAAIAAEALLGRILTGDYDSLAGWHGHVENVGAMVDEFGQPMPDVFDDVGRRVNVSTNLVTLGSTGVKVRGRTVMVRAFDSDNRALVEISRFVAEPQP